MRVQADSQRTSLILEHGALLSCAVNGTAPPRQLFTLFKDLGQKS